MTPPARKGARATRPSGVKTKRTAARVPSRSRGITWAYAYQLVPPQTKSQLRAVTTLLDREHTAARNRSHVWAGRLVLGARMTRILVVSDSLERIRQVSRKLESELKQLDVVYSVTAPVALLSGATASPP